jgi:hypothetical protein
MLGVAAEIQQDLVELRPVGQDPGPAGLDVLAKLDGGGQGGAQEPQGLSDDVLQRDGLPRLFHLAAEGEDLLDERFGPRAAARISWSCAEPGLPSARSSADNSAWPMMAPRMLLKSWAIPPAKVPMASIFWAWRSWPSSRFRAVMSRSMAAKPTILPAGSLMEDRLRDTS